MSDNPIVLYQFPTAPGFFNASPYCTKAEILLRLAGLNFTSEFPENYKELPKGKLPVIKDGDTIIPDSEFIQNYISEKYGHDFKAGFSAEQKATAHALCRMLEERTVVFLRFSRWVDEAGWAQTKAIFFSEVPDEEAEAVHENVKAVSQNNDVWHHSQEEREQLLRADLQAVADILGNTPYIMGDNPTYVDAVAFPMIANLYGSLIRTWTTAIVAEFPTLVAYFDRGMDLWFPEGKELVA